MINLLPRDEMRQLRAARSNVLLARYNVLMAGAFVFLLLAVAVTWVQLTITKTNAENNIAINQDKSQGFIPVQNQADEFRKNLATAKQILDKEVLYTKVVLDIAKVMPKGVVLEGLSLDSQAFGQPTVLIAHAKDYESALKLKETFQASNIFSDVHFDSIATGGDTSTDGDYPVTVNLNVTIKKDAAK